MAAHLASGSKRENAPSSTTASSFTKPCTATGATKPSAPARRPSSAASPQAANACVIMPTGGGKIALLQLPAVLDAAPPS